jgi:pilus assembly protein Flp/PilA
MADQIGIIRLAIIGTDRIGYFARSKAMNKWIALWKDEDGLTTVEYAIAGGLISAAVVGAFIALGGSVNTIITFLNTQLGRSPALAGGG